MACKCWWRSAVALDLLLELIKALGEQIAKVMGRLELSGQHPLGAEDARQHLDAMCQSLCA
jgi:hypothetical protein